MGTVIDIFRSAEAGGPMESLVETALLANRGIPGDRYFADIGTFSEKPDRMRDPGRDLTLIEQEEVETFMTETGLTLAPGALRRNIVTRGIRLNPLVGARFQVGTALVEGVRLCEPCAYLAKLVDHRVLPGLVQRAGLRVRIVESGIVRRGDSLTGLRTV